MTWLYLILAGIGVDVPDVAAVDAVTTLRANLQQYPTVRVVWSRRSREGKDKADIIGGLIARYKKRLGESGVPETERTYLRRDLKTFEIVLANLQPDHVNVQLQDYWTDWSNYQVRVPLLTVEKTFAPGDFPSAEAFRDNLKTQFRSIAVISRGAATGNSNRGWGGEPTAGMFTATSGEFPINQFSPPLLTSGQLKSHSYDQIFAIPDEGWLKSHRTVIDGQPALLVVGKRSNNTGIRVYLSETQGYIPLAMRTYLWDDCLLKLDHPEAGPPSAGIEIISSKIEEIAPGAYYPIRGVERTFSMNSRWKVGDLMTAEMGGESEVIEWEVHKFEVDRPMSKANFALEFPANTILFNPDSKQMFVVGDMDSIAERFVPTKMLAEDSSSSWSVAWWGLIVAMVTASGLVFRRIWRRRSSA